MIRVLSYNIRCNVAVDGENAWPHRKERVAELLTQHEPDLIGLQEVLADQLEDLIQRLPAFDWIGVGRTDGETGGEYVPIFYRRERFTLEASGTFWLSETPDVVGSVGWDASLPRVVTWAKLIDRQTAAPMLHVNTHFDHRGMDSQVQAAYLLRRFLADQSDPCPSVTTGDFNCTEESATYAALTKAGANDSATAALPIVDEPLSDAPPLLDTMHLSQTPHSGPLETFNGTFTDPLQAKIDYIFVQHPPADPPVIQRHAILADQQDGRYPSDHLPVLVEMVV